MARLGCYVVWEKRMSYASIPWITAWFRFRDARKTGTVTFATTGNLRTYCILCQFEVDYSACQDIKIGCLVKRDEIETFTVCGVEYEDKKTKINPVYMKGLGCPDCQSQYLRARGKEAARVEEVNTRVLRDLKPHLTKGLEDKVLMAHMKKTGTKWVVAREVWVDVTNLVLEARA